MDQWKNEGSALRPRRRFLQWECSTAKGADLLWPWLVGIAAFGFVLRWGLAVVLPNVYRPDEIFQNLEPAYRMWSGHGIMTWEWHEGIRSPLYPGFLAALIAGSAKLGMGAAGYLAVIAAVLSLNATGTVVVGVLVGWRQFRWTGAVICGVLCAVWPDLVHLGPKALTEAQAGDLLILATYVAAYRPEAGEDQATLSLRALRSVAVRMFGGGFLLSVVFCLRFHLTPALLLVAFWACRLEFRKRWLWLLAGACLPILAMGIADYFFWGSFFRSVWRNYQLNILEHVSSAYGVQPFDWFFSSFAYEWRFAVVPVVVGFLVGVRRAPILGSVAAIILLSHSVLAHKELSFVYAALPPLLIVAGLGTSQVVEWIVRARTSSHGMVEVGTAVVFWMVVSAVTATGPGFWRLWWQDGSVLKAEASLRKEPSLCGLGLRTSNVNWWDMGGDVYLGRPVLMYGYQTAAEIARVSPAINFAIGGRDVADGMPGFSVTQCWNVDREVCVARALPDKACIPDSKLEFNSVPTLGRMWAPVPAPAKP